MKKFQVLWLLSTITIVVLVLMPFHALLTVVASQLVGHYTVLRLWKELLLVPLALGAARLLYKDARLWREARTSWLIRLIFTYFAIQLVWGLVAYALHGVSAQALGYGWLSDTRYLVFFLAVWAIAAKSPSLMERWQKIVFWPAAIVVVFGLLQYFILPYDFLGHVGYSNATIFPYEDINHNTHFIRVMSSLRGANPLGAYMVFVLGMLLAAYRKHKAWWYIFMATAAIVLILTFSRAAWLGFGACAAVFAWVRLFHDRAIKHAKRLVPVVVVLLGLVSAGSVVLLPRSTTFQNIVLHTQTHSAVRTTSDQGHSAALRSGIHDILHEPLGRGPGTAGPASAYNNRRGVRIAENYYIQIAQETGLIGLGLFAAILITVANILWRRRTEVLPLGLLGTLVGISIINLFSHAWADDTLAYVWWGLAGIALAYIPRPNRIG